MEQAVLLFYILVKYAAYALWCCLGVRIVHSAQFPAVLLSGLGWGVLRLFMGFILGLGIQYVTQTLYSSDPRPNSLYIYLIAYVPVRILEWWIMMLLISIRSANRGAGGFRLLWRVSWIIGGIFISCLADIPVFYALGGFPVGRFMC
jgi:hypothetical protein